MHYFERDYTICQTKKENGDFASCECNVRVQTSNATNNVTNFMYKMLNYCSSKLYN